MQDGPRRFHTGMNRPILNYKKGSNKSLQNRSVEISHQNSTSGDEQQIFSDVKQSGIPDIYSPQEFSRETNSSSQRKVLEKLQTRQMFRQKIMDKSLRDQEREKVLEKAMIPNKYNSAKLDFSNIYHQINLKMSSPLNSPKLIKFGNDMRKIIQDNMKEAKEFRVFYSESLGKGYYDIIKSILQNSLQLMERKIGLLHLGYQKFVSPFLQLQSEEMEEAKQSEISNELMKIKERLNQLQRLSVCRRQCIAIIQACDHNTVFNEHYQEYVDQERGCQILQQKVDDLLKTCENSSDQLSKRGFLFITNLPEANIQSLKISQQEYNNLMKMFEFQERKFLIESRKQPQYLENNINGTSLKSNQDKALLIQFLFKFRDYYFNEKRKNNEDFIQTLEKKFAEIYNDQAKAVWIITTYTLRIIDCLQNFESFQYFENSFQDDVNLIEKFLFHLNSPLDPHLLEQIKTIRSYVVFLNRFIKLTSINQDSFNQKFAQLLHIFLRRQSNQIELIESDLTYFTDILENTKVNIKQICEPLDAINPYFDYYLQDMAMKEIMRINHLLDKIYAAKKIIAAEQLAFNYDYGLLNQIFSSFLPFLINKCEMLIIQTSNSEILYLKVLQLNSAKIKQQPIEEELKEKRQSLLKECLHLIQDSFYLIEENRKIVDAIEIETYFDYSLIDKIHRIMFKQNSRNENTLHFKYETNSSLVKFNFEIFIRENQRVFAKSIEQCTLESLDLETPQEQKQLVYQNMISLYIPTSKIIPSNECFANVQITVQSPEAIDLTFVMRIPLLNQHISSYLQVSKL